MSVALASFGTSFESRNDLSSHLYCFAQNTDTFSYKNDDLNRDRGLNRDREKAILINTINIVAKWKDNWDNHGSDAPKPHSIDNAKNWLQRILTIAHDYNMPWLTPSISTDEYGNVVCEWWNLNRKLTLDFTEIAVDYTKITNTDTTPDFEMNSFSSLSNTEQYTILSWLFVER